LQNDFLDVVNTLEKKRKAELQDTFQIIIDALQKQCEAYNTNDSQHEHTKNVDDIGVIHLIAMVCDWYATWKTYSNKKEKWNQDSIRFLNSYYKRYENWQYEALENVFYLIEESINS